MFDPGCEFLLDLLPENLFEPTGSTTDVRCKGCRGLLKRWERQRHHDGHVRELRRLEEKRREKIRTERVARLALARKERRRAA